MAESCKYCESELSPMDGVYIQSELHMSPQKVQNLIEHNQNMVCYNCFKRLKSMKIVEHEKDLKIIKNPKDAYRLREVRTFEFYRWRFLVVFGR